MAKAKKRLKRLIAPDAALPIKKDKVVVQQNPKKRVKRVVRRNNIGWIT